jgi:hypothetical protein
MSLYETTVPQFKKMLTSLDRWLQAAVAYAETKKFDPNTLVVARLAPDQFPLGRQVQAACDQAKFGVARVTGKEPPKHADTEQTIDELRTRIRTMLEYLDTFSPADFAGKEDALIVLPFADNKKMLGRKFITEITYPNFYFHVTTAYAILRHNGVNLGKKDFLGPMTFA